MKYAELIERVLAKAGGSLPLAELLDHVDAMDKSVPTLDELNAALSQIQRDGQFPKQDCGPVAPEAYKDAVSGNRERMIQLLERQGMSREQQQTVLQRYLALIGKHET